VRKLTPDVIVNAAAYTAVDKAENDVARAQCINAVAPGVLAGAAAEVGALLVHYSTDYVFDGSGDNAWREDSPTSPLSVYGRTKLAGEDAIRTSGCRHMIFRTSWVHAARGGNFALTMLRLAAERERLTVIADQIGAPTGADLIADVSAHAIRASLAAPALCGTYHLVADGETSWHGYARFVIETARELGVVLKADEIAPIATRDYPTAAARPLNSRLDTHRLRSAFGLYLPDWRDGVARMLREILV
jgi:dTDP-4-dehydrorhamnose reductase